MMNSEKNSFEYLWSTPILKILLPIEFDSHLIELKSKILSEHSNSPDFRLDGEKHNVWDWALPSVDWLKKQFNQLAQDYLTKLSNQDLTEKQIESSWGRAWANVLKKDQGYFYQSIHAHHESDFFVIFYVEAGDSSLDSGSLVLQDSRFLNNTHLLQRENRIKIVPQTGMALVAPGYVWHEVLPYSSFKPRISIACNFQYSLKNIRD